MLAALRSASVGTDVRVYAVPLFDLAEMCDRLPDFYRMYWWQGWDYTSPSDYEIGYTMLVWLCSRLTDSPQSLLLMTQLLTFGPIAWSVFVRRDRLTFPIAIAVYLFMYFNTSLNAMRQWIAVAFLFLALIGTYKEGEKLGRQIFTFVWLLVAGLFHYSAFLFGPILLTVRVFLDDSSTSVKGRAIAICSAGFLMLCSVNLVADALQLVGLGKYVGYLGGGAVTFMPNQLILRIPIILMFVITLRQTKRRCGESIIDKSDGGLVHFLLVVSVLAIIASQLSGSVAYSARIAVYLDVFSIATLAYMVSIASKQNTSNIILVMACGLYIVTYWFYYYGYGNSGETVPYSFFW